MFAIDQHSTTLRLFEYHEFSFRENHIIAESTRGKSSNPQDIGAANYRSLKYGIVDSGSNFAEESVRLNIKLTTVGVV